MKKNSGEHMPHAITAVVFVVFIVLGLACATRPSVGGSSELYFDTCGGIGKIVATQYVKRGESITIPGGEGLSLGGATFTGWYCIYSDGEVATYNAGESFTPPGGYIDFYAKWELDADDLNSVTGLANKLVWLQNNAKSGNDYTIELSDNESIGNHTLIYPGRNNITITLKGIDSNRIISSAINDRLFYVTTGVKLVLDKNITLKGHINNKKELVYTWKNGILQMNDGFTITGNGGPGVLVHGTFEMNGGTISGNKANFGGGVSVGAGGIFSMKGGIISGNNCSGVFIWNDGTFVMSGGNIMDNTASEGGGVTVYYDGTFNMKGGTISGNKATNGEGGGVIVMERGTFTMNQGIISRNTTNGIKRGGGIYLGNNTIFRRTGGTVSGNVPDDIYQLPSQ